jgi:hypothetical protein
MEDTKAMLRAIARAKLLTRAELYRLDLTLEAEADPGAKEAIKVQQSETLAHLYSLQKRMIQIRVEGRQEDEAEHAQWTKEIARAKAEEAASAGTNDQQSSPIRRVGKAIGEDLEAKQRSLPAPLQGKTDLWSTRTPSPGNSPDKIKRPQFDEAEAEDEVGADISKQNGETDTGAKPGKASDLPFAEIDAGLQQQAAAALKGPISDPCNQSRTQDTLGECAILGPLWPLPEEGELAPALGVAIGDMTLSVGYITETGEKPDDPDHVNQVQYILLLYTLYTPLIHSSHTLLSYTPLIHSSHTLLSYTPLIYC